MRCGGVVGSVAEGTVVEGCPAAGAAAASSVREDSRGAFEQPQASAAAEATAKVSVGNRMGGMLTRRHSTVIDILAV